MDPFAVDFLQPLIAALLIDLHARADKLYKLNILLQKGRQDSAAEEFVNVAIWLCKVFLQGLPFLKNNFPGS